METFRKFLVMQWKNLLLKLRHWVQTISEVVIPTLLFIGIVIIRTEGGEGITPVYKPAVVNMSEPYTWQYCTSLIDLIYNGTLVNRTLAYTNRPIGFDSDSVPDSQLVDDIMDLVGSTIENVLWPLCSLNITDVKVKLTESVGTLSKFCLNLLPLQRCNNRA